MRWIEFYQCGIITILNSSQGPSTERARTIFIAVAPIFDFSLHLPWLCSHDTVLAPLENNTSSLRNIQTTYSPGRIMNLASKKILHNIHVLLTQSPPHRHASRLLFSSSHRSRAERSWNTTGHLAWKTAAQPPRAWTTRLRGGTWEFWFLQR